MIYSMADNNKEANQPNLSIVRALRLSVKAWREGGYKEGTTKTIRQLVEQPITH